MKKTQITFIEIPAWTYVGAEKGWYALATALSLAGLENRYVKLSATTQRAILGDTRIGKQSIGIFNGQLMLSRRVCFGTDSDTRPVNPADASMVY